MAKIVDDRAAELKRENAALRRQLDICHAELNQAREQQTATAEVLQVINSSPGDLAPVFNAILEKAHTLCGAAAGGLVEIEGEQYRAVAVHGKPRLAEWWIQQGWIHSDTGAFAPLRQGECIHLPDVTADDGGRRSEQYHRLIELSGARSLLVVPLRKDNALRGAITAFRQEVRPFTDREIALLQNFAAQAVIAMENARLLTETREALDQQTATAEVLQVINSSPGDLAPVFDAMLDKAMRLCQAAFGLLHTYDGERFRALAISGVSRATAEALQEWIPDPGSALERIVLGDRVVHIPDVVATEAYRSGVASRLKLVELTGARTALWVALRKDDAPVGAFVIYRKEVRPFSDKQIALLQNFAAQAVIAMENARLLTETREALEQQTATAEVLQVINSSPGDLTPVFDAIVAKAMHLCDAAFGYIVGRKDGEAFGHTLATREIPADYAEFRKRNPVRAGQAADCCPDRLLRESPLFTSLDLKDDDLYRRGDPFSVAPWLISAGRERPSLCRSSREAPTPARHDKSLPPGGARVHRQADRAVAEFRRAGGHCNGECAALDRDARSVGAADRDRRGIAGHQFLSRRPRTGFRRDARKGHAAMRSDRCGFAYLRWQCDFMRQRCSGVSSSVLPTLDTRSSIPDPATGLGRIENGERVVQFVDLLPIDSLTEGGDA